MAGNGGRAKGREEVIKPKHLSEAKGYPRTGPSGVELLRLLASHLKSWGTKLDSDLPV